jgi:hypothetical protein
MRRTVILTAMLVLGALGAVAGDGHEHEATAIDDPRFEFLKSLQGTWVGKSDMEGMPPELSFEFRLTAGGTAIQEREMIGTPMEMLTVYHMQGADLVATHYCMLGNQPRATAAAGVVGRTLEFGCDGTPGNAASHDDEHIHGWSIRLAEDGKLYYSARLLKDGRVNEAPGMVLQRQQTRASR